MRSYVFLGLVIMLFIKGGYLPKVKAEIPLSLFWFRLNRASNIEYFYVGSPGKETQSILLKIFPVKTGLPAKRPTPLPQLFGQEYWIISKKEASSTNPETAPFFLTLNIPYSDTYPYGPEPYTECHGQCDWSLPGAFGLHGVGGNKAKLASLDPGSSGCIRHTDQDITYLYNVLDPQSSEIRYYVENK